MKKKELFLQNGQAIMEMVLVLPFIVAIIVSAQLILGACFLQKLLSPMLQEKG